MPTVELVYDADCPNVDLARAQLLRAFAAIAMPARWREWRRDEHQAPSRIRAYGSPTILVNGRDIVPAAGDAACCRLYAHTGGALSGVPPVESIVTALRTGVKGPSSWRSAGLWLPAVGVAFVPKLVCPACWPAYAALVSAAGLPFLLETRFLLPITLFALTLVIGLLMFHARVRRGYGPATLGIASAIVIVLGKFAFSSTPAAYVGASLLFAACVWNSWPRRKPMDPACRACEAQDSRQLHQILERES